MIDFHSHILPGIDDGSESLEESIAMLRLEAEQGITHVIATPHFHAWYDTPRQFLERRAVAEAQLREEMEKCTNLPEMMMGAEVTFFRGMSESEYLPLLTIMGGRAILIEMPAFPWSDGICRELEQIRNLWGITPVIAHVDRYITVFNKSRLLRQLEELPVLVQGNADFFLNRFTSGLAMKMLKSDQIHLLGSDCHNMTGRKPNLGAAAERIERKLGSEVISGIHGYERRILDLEV